MNGSSKLFREKYEYEPLAQHDSFRLLKLMPASTYEGELLECDLVQSHPSEGPSYDVLSYGWGVYLVTQGIRVAGRVFWITSHLESALRSSLEEDRPRYLWVDAICVNQTDIEERHSQMGLMKTILSRARCLLIWLGMSASGTKRSFMCLEKLAASAKAYGIQTWSNSNDPIMLSSERQMFDKLPGVVNVWELERIYDSSWFNRLWTILDVAFAHKAKIFSGRNQIDFDDFVKATAIIKKFIRSQDCIGSPLKDLNIGQASSLITTWQMSSYDKAAGLSTKLSSMKRILYYLYHNRQACTNDKDRIYAILDIERSHFLEFSPDYNESVTQVYSKFAKTYLMQGVFDVLGFAGILFTLYKDGSDQDPQERWPSWVPDWRFPEPLTEPFSCGTSWQAATKLAPKVEFDDPESQDSSICVHGIILDSIELGVIIIEPSSHTPVDALRQMAQYSSKARALYDTHRGEGSYATGENSLTAFVRTITLDSDFSKADALTSKIDAGSVAVNMWLKYEDECVKWNNRSNYDRANQRQLEVQDSWRFSPYAELLAARIKNRQFFITSEKWIGMAPWFALRGDKIAILAGAETPFILRPSGNEEKYRIVADCYLHGSMYGELLNEVLLSAMQKIIIV
ncbi:hypothetical protein MMC18_003630 [Xylographa bjoerkii]|nr:hypothetical protein [Xylographa bjoerkii]